MFSCTVAEAQVHIGNFEDHFVFRRFPYLGVSRIWAFPVLRRLPHTGWDRLPLLPVLVHILVAFDFGWFVFRASGCIYGVARFAGLHAAGCALGFYWRFHFSHK